MIGYSMKLNITGELRTDVFPYDIFYDFHSTSVLVSKFRNRGLSKKKSIYGKETTQKIKLSITQTQILNCISNAKTDPILNIKHLKV